MRLPSMKGRLGIEKEQKVGSQVKEVKERVLSTN